MDNDLAQLLVRLWGLQQSLGAEAFDAVAVFTGCGEVHWVLGGLQLAQQHPVPNLVILEGNQEEVDRGDAAERQQLVDRFLGQFKIQTRIVVSRVMLHTPDQSAELRDMVERQAWRRVVLVSSHWHLPRVMLTMIKSVLYAMPYATAPLPVLIPYMAPCPLSRPIPGNVTHAIHDARDMVREELRKIVRYQAKGDIATLPELERYIALIGA